MKIEKQRKNNSKAKSKPCVKTFDEYFQECIKNKTIPPNTPPYLKKALKRALKEHKEWITKEKSALENFAEKYTMMESQELHLLNIFKLKPPQIKDLFRKSKFGWY